ncbi:hypothetical protein SKAU_G00262060 [Synaphobranchus kaupii]|uniref:Uncharacterized protein n=1 Tax=Synaphobranchus kaupii TaxID=118154 RepID=A0A9Q1EYK4_SYNKA|nr:hypothetical protein SKAU_G00262060 [Synaphobranchus kaupii]
MLPEPFQIRSVRVARRSNARLLKRGDRSLSNTWPQAARQTAHWAGLTSLSSTRGANGRSGAAVGRLPLAASRLSRYDPATQRRQEILNGIEPEDAEPNALRFQRSDSCRSSRRPQKASVTRLRSASPHLAALNTAEPRAIRDPGNIRRLFNKGNINDLERTRPPRRSGNPRRSVGRRLKRSHLDAAAALIKNSLMWLPWLRRKEKNNVVVLSLKPLETRTLMHRRVPKDDSVPYAALETSHGNDFSF